MNPFMKNQLAIFAAAVVAFAAPAARAEHTRVTYPSAVGAEVLGRGLLYSVFFDRAMNDDMVAGVGFGTVGVTATNGGRGTASMLPVYMNYYFTRDQGSLFASIGATVVLNAADVETAKTRVGNLTYAAVPVVPVAGLGYENRGDSGFLFRLTAYAMYAEKFVPWAGFSFGWAF